MKTQYSSNAMKHTDAAYDTNTTSLLFILTYYLHYIHVFSCLFIFLTGNTILRFLIFQDAKSTLL